MKRRMTAPVLMLLKSVKTVEFLEKHNKIRVSYNEPLVQHIHHLLIELFSCKT